MDENVLQLLVYALLLGITLFLAAVDLEKPVTQEQREKLRTFWGGFYSQRVPLLAHHITVQENGEDGLEATVSYLWFGSIGVSLDSEGLPSITKPLSGL